MVTLYCWWLTHLTARCANALRDQALLSWPETWRLCKVDRHGARPDWVVDRYSTHLLTSATDEQLDFPIIYAGAERYRGSGPRRYGGMTPLYQAIVDHVPAPDVDLDGPLQMQISQLGYNNYVGVIGIGRIKRAAK